jgi:hypothetical protein
MEPLFDCDSVRFTSRDGIVTWYYYLAEGGDDKDVLLLRWLNTVVKWRENTQMLVKMFEDFDVEGGEVSGIFAPALPSDDAEKQDRYSISFTSSDKGAFLTYEPSIKSQKNNPKLEAFVIFRDRKKVRKLIEDTGRFYRLC